ncbi:MAG: hypothetical protein RJB66_709 [Pseudomonadota bacterium]|jgi:hypothetical protein
MIGFLVVLLVVDLLLLVYLNRKPICFESNLVEQIDWISTDSSSKTVYNCEAHRKVPISKVFIERMDDIQKRIALLEGHLKSGFLPLIPTKIVIQEGVQQLVQVSSDQITIGEGAFFGREELTLEKAYLKSWIQQYQKGHGLGILRLEVLTQFLMANLGIHDRNYRQWQMVLGQWPQLATSWSGYCQSPVKDESFTNLCISPSFEKRAESLAPFTLHFWFAQKLWQSFQVLSVKEQMQFFKKLNSFIEVLSAAAEVSIDEMTLEELDAFSRQEIIHWRASFERLGFNDWGWNFASKVLSDLDAHKDSLGRVDLLMKKDRSWTTDELLSLQKIAVEEVNYRIVAENYEGLRAFPWLTPTRPEAFPELKAQNLVWITCEWPKVADLLEIRRKAEKVIVVQECEEKAAPLLVASLLHRGLQFFSLDNKDSKFIQLNLESLAYLVGRDSSLLKKRMIIVPPGKKDKNFISEKAGWKSVLWNQRYRAYEVHSTIEVIEWFKLPENTWPDFE